MLKTLYVERNELLIMLEDMKSDDSCDECNAALDEAHDRVADMGDCELPFICEYAIDNDFGYGAARHQLRCLWTAYCIHNEIYRNSEIYNLKISQLWDCVKENRSNPWVDKENKTEPDLDRFDMFMSELVS